MPATLQRPSRERPSRVRDEELIVQFRFFHLIDTFEDLAFFSAALLDTERLKSRMIIFALDEATRHLPGSSKEAVIEGRVKLSGGDDALSILVDAFHTLREFRIGSDPKATLNITYQFLTLFLTLFLNYDKIGPNAQLLKKDFQNLTERVEGMSEAQKQRVLFQGEQMCDFFLRNGEVFFNEVATKCKDLRERLNESARGEVHISVL